MYNAMTIGIVAGIILISLITLGLILARLYKRATKEMSFVRTGWRGQKVVKDGGALVLPVLHEAIPVNMNTLRLEVRRSEGDALITRDRMRVDVTAEFYVRVAQTEDAIANAAQTLGLKTLYPDQLKELVEGKFVDALRAVAATMSMQELHEQRTQFVLAVQQAVAEDLDKNGLELESVSLTGLDQTSIEHFNANNAFDAEGLTRLTEEIQARAKRRNEIEQDTSVAIKTKNLEAAQKTLQIEREEEYARLEQQREVEIRRAAQAAEIARQRAERQREAEQAEIAAKQEVELSNIAAKRAVEQQEIEKQQTVETRRIEQKKALEIAEQERMIAVSEKSKSESEAKSEADRARAEAVKAEEEVSTTRAIAEAERAKRIEIIRATEQAERDAVAVTVSAKAELQAAEDRRSALLLQAAGEAEAEERRAQAKAKTYAVEAEGKRAINDAQNVLSVEQIGMQIRLALIDQMPEIIKQSVEPMKQIDGIKILHIDGMFGRNGAAAGETSSGGSFADNVVDSALRYRGQAPLVDSLLAELGIDGRSLAGMTKETVARSLEPTASEATPVVEDAGTEALLETPADVESVPVADKAD